LFGAASSVSLMNNNSPIRIFDQPILGCFLDLGRESFAGCGFKWSKMARNGPNWLRMA
jgi:hypothetical protein